MLPNIGPVELIIILVIALIVIGPGRLPDVGAALGKSIREFRKASSDITEAARVDTSPLPPAAAAPQAAQAPAAPNTLTTESAPNTIAAPPVQAPAAPPVAADPSAATTPESPSASPAPTPEPSQPVPTSTAIPAPIQAPPVGDDGARPPA